jgi:hypothetical protein
MVRFAGADPGFSGAIALLTGDGRDIEFIVPFPATTRNLTTKVKGKHKTKVIVDFNELDSIIRVGLCTWDLDIHMCIEEVSEQGRTSATGIAQLMVTYAALHQAVAATKGCIQLVDYGKASPQSWKKIYPLLHKAGAGIEDRNEKTKVIDAAAIATVKEVFPNSWQKICPPHKSRPGVFNAPNPNWADAALLANYAKHVYQMTTAKVA